MTIKSIEYFQFQNMFFLQYYSLILLILFILLIEDINLLFGERNKKEGKNQNTHFL